MVRLSFFIVLFSLSSLAGQDDFLRSLAVEVCDCLDGNASELVATDCLEAVALSKEKRIRQEYGLEVSIPVQRDLLSASMVDYLLEVCPLLRTIRPNEDYREFRWADGKPSISESRRFTTAKRPLADTLVTITSEPPATWRASGRLLAQPGSKGLRLLNVDNQEMNFELPSSAARKRDFDPGDEISLTYRREWRPAEGVIVLVVVGID